jgi:NAD(P)-dependent dehydrogenase (short-subunit alcohol dehydrogenase family)
LPSWRSGVDCKTQGQLNILVNNVGITRDQTLRKMTDEDRQFCPGQLVGEQGRHYRLHPTAALELARYNVACNALAPGFTETSMLSKLLHGPLHRHRRRPAAGIVHRKKSGAKT